MNIIQQYRNRLLVRNLSFQTVNTYTSIAENLLKIDENFFGKPQDEIIAYLAEKIEEGRSSSYVGQLLAVITGIRTQILGIDDAIKIKRPIREVSMPDVLTTDEFQRLYSSISNLKHRAIVALMYSTGMRVGEVISLKLRDIDSGNGKIIIRKPKGKIDRVVVLDASVLKLLQEYFLEYQPHAHVFAGQTGCSYSDRSIQNIIKSACKKAGINKNITTHSMRHSCFTQLIKNGVDIRTVQRLAGHKNIATTAGYLRITDEDVLGIKSPIQSISI